MMMKSLLILLVLQLVIVTSHACVTNNICDVDQNAAQFVELDKNECKLTATAYNLVAPLPKGVRVKFEDDSNENVCCFSLDKKKYYCPVRSLQVRQQMENAEKNNKVTDKDLGLVKNTLNKVKTREQDQLKLVHNEEITAKNAANEYAKLITPGDDYFTNRNLCYRIISKYNDVQKMQFQNWLMEVIMGNSMTLYEQLKLNKEDFNIQALFMKSIFIRLDKDLEKTVKADRKWSANEWHQAYVRSFLAKLIHIQQGVYGNHEFDEFAKKITLLKVSSMFADISFEEISSTTTKLLKKSTYLDLITAANRVFQNDRNWNKRMNYMGQGVSLIGKTITAALSTAALIGISFTPATALGASAVAATIGVLGAAADGAFNYVVDKDGGVRDMRLSLNSEDLKAKIDTYIATQSQNYGCKLFLEDVNKAREQRHPDKPKIETCESMPKFYKTKMSILSECDDLVEIVNALLAPFKPFEAPKPCQQMYHTKVTGWNDVNQFLSIIKEITYLWPDYSLVLNEVGDTDSNIMASLDKLSSIQLSDSKLFGK